MNIFFNDVYGHTLLVDRLRIGSISSMLTGLPPLNQLHVACSFLFYRYAGYAGYAGYV